jgi:hypothetical protein
MKKTKIKFEDIKAGDLLEVVVIDDGVKSVLTAVAFEIETLKIGQRDVQVWWKTSEGGMIVTKEEEAGIFRLEIGEVKFEDIKAGDRVRVTEKTGKAIKTLEDTAVVLVDSGFVGYWLNDTGEIVLFRIANPMAERTIEILERGE